MRWPASQGLAIAAVASLLAGCAPQPPDFREFRAHEPRTILVLPPLNNTVDVTASYGYLSTVTMPLAELGYYVIPVGVADALMKDNGLPTPGEMHSVPVQKLGEVFGADAVLDVTITEWGTKYIVISSNTVVGATAALIDTKTGTQLWRGEVHLVKSSGGSGNLFADLIVAVIDQIVNSSTDQAHLLSRPANFQLLTNAVYGIPPGARNPAYGSDRRGR